MQGKSYLHLTWLTESEITADRFGKTRISRYYKNPPLIYDEDKPFNPDFVEVDRILDSKIDHETGEIKYLVKWESLPYTEATWELASDVKVHLSMLCSPAPPPVCVICRF